MAVLYSVARAVGRAVIPGLFRAGYSATSALKLLQIEGYGYRATDFFADFREFAQVRERLRFFGAMPTDQRPPIATMIKKASPVGGKYTYRFRALMHDETTGKERWEYKSISFEDRFTVEEAEERLVHKLDEAEYDRYETYVRGRLSTVLRR